MQDYISIPVPVDRVQEVYELLARPKASAPETPEPHPADETDTALDGVLIERAYRESPDTMKKVFDSLAASPDRVVPMNELAKATGYTGQSQMAGALGAFGRRWKNRYHGGKDTKWPFESWWDFERNTMVYRMSSAVAKVIKGL